MDLFVYKSQWIQVLNSFRVFLSGYMCTEDWVHIAKTGLFFLVKWILVLKWILFFKHKRVNGWTGFSGMCNVLGGG